MAPREWTGRGCGTYLILGGGVAMGFNEQGGGFEWTRRGLKDREGAWHLFNTGRGRGTYLILRGGVALI